jgi:hypothetical protein
MGFEGVGGPDWRSTGYWEELFWSCGFSGPVFGDGRELLWAAFAVLGTETGCVVHSRFCAASEYCGSCRSTPTGLALSAARVRETAD